MTTTTKWIDILRRFIFSRHCSIPGTVRPNLRGPTFRRPQQKVSSTQSILSKVWHLAKVNKLCRVAQMWCHIYRPSLGGPYICEVTSVGRIIITLVLIRCLWYDTLNPNKCPTFFQYNLELNNCKMFFHSPTYAFKLRLPR